MRTESIRPAVPLLVSLALAACTIAPPPSPVDSGPGTTPGIDAAAAPLRISIFMDYGCAPCGEAIRTVRELAPAYQGRVLVTVRDFITPQVNPGAYQAAIAARCAQEQAKGDAYGSLIFASQVDWPKFTEGLLTTWALQAQLDQSAFLACVQAKRPAQAIADDLRDGKLLGVRSTPTVFLGSVQVEAPVDTEGWRGLIDGSLRATVRVPSLPSASEE